MKSLVVILIGSISFLSYGQENNIKSITIAWEQLGAPLSLVNDNSNINTYQLLEVDLSVDLRQQYLKKNASPMMLLPDNKSIQSEYNFSFPQPKKGNVGFSVSGNGYNANVNSTGEIKNTAYKDASLYSGAFCPITGLAY
ncbi:hypothetical protein [Aquimarina celericrescens]|uniref:Uncharacterized protein n=1 Tax=Aquimarina celericrescens TaxID=1964542 RepID=A0ABW5AQY1_9FLAO|nr:hypothetical protein [Aquimarina celericrescens]